MPSPFKVKPLCRPMDITYRVSDDREVITFMPCGRQSHHPQDIAQRYCAACDRFMDLVEIARSLGWPDLPEERRR